MISQFLLAILLILLISGITIFIIYKTHIQQQKHALKELESQYLVPRDRKSIVKLELESTSSGQELLARILTPLIPEGELEMVDDLAKETPIVMWGPIASGKSALVAAFEASTYKYYQTQDIQYDFILDGERLNPFLINPKDVFNSPTYQLTNFRLLFSRRFRRKNFRTRISSHKHQVLIIDGPGYPIFHAFDDRSLEISDTQLAPYRTVLQNSSGIIVILEPGINCTPAEYLEILRKTLNRLNSISVAKYYVFCITKADLAPRSSDFKTILAHHFGENIAVRILDLIEEQGRKSPCLLCTTSAAGYINRDGHLSPNYDSHTGSLLDETIWEPVGVAKPFFWIFEQVEKQRIANKFKQTMLGSLLRKNALGQYIEYPKAES